MREIKFRAWDKRFKKMDSGSGDLLLRINAKDFSEPMQYTGLKSKSGKEIYEGDIVTADDGAQARYEVIFHKGAFCYPKLGAYHIFNEKKTEVIGNVYENPGLLGERYEA